MNIELFNEFKDEQEPLLIKSYNLAFNSFAAILYFLTTYRDACFPIYSGSAFFIEWKKNKLVIPDGFSLEKCKRARFIFGLILLGENTLSHANAFVIDIKENVVEIFEPNGKASINENYMTDIKEFFTSLNLQVYDDFDVCPRQNFKEGASGFCQMWSLWWIEYRLKNPEIPRNILINHAVEQFNRTSAVTFIENYTRYIVVQRNELFLRVFERLGDTARGITTLENMEEALYFDNPYSRVFTQEIFEILSQELHNYLK